MLSLLSSVFIAQATPTSLVSQQYLIQPQEIRTLPGELNKVNVFNSNSPEVVQTEGILLSTFPGSRMRFPNAHLQQTLEGRFDLFTHHIARPQAKGRMLYQGVIVYNPSDRLVRVRVLQAASYLTNPDAPFINLPSILEDRWGRFFSGPGSRLMGEILRGYNDPHFPNQIVIPPGQSRMLFGVPIPNSSARSTFMRLDSSGSIYVANLAMYGKPNTSGGATKTANVGSIRNRQTAFREPTLEEWQKLLLEGGLVYPRDIPPTPLDDPTIEKTIYGRVSGISVGSEWVATLVDPGTSDLSIPARGKAFSYPLSTVNQGTHGTQQIQSAPMLVRYPDTAFLAHGNYAVHYNLTLPLVNNTEQPQTITISIQTPIKQDEYSDRLFFREPPQGQVFFRGPVRVEYKDDRGLITRRYFHIIQRQGQQGQPMITLNLEPGESREVNIDFLYPPDATPPQVLTVRSMDSYYISPRDRRPRPLGNQMLPR
ncbi:DUF3370 domain-containing protein [Candidatus Gracilibacteria bacterium]|nr:DUF3370 domain-containing protein [Candidatus Gracilibacteria bacterium]NJM86420.1 DUF3370 domain-containing protein [Hydrococcus sp. RU_2_2]NJP19572.1 DUF3370 domain-containing protein [Hydrococcus sp. CRU_1_1]